ncbi:MAG: nicotinate-nucleotide adenylyltransferase [bacterium]
MKPKDRIGVLGGTFNPVHMGHLIMAQDALEQFDLNTVTFVPCACPAHKPARDVAAAEHRLAMLEAAVEGDLRFEVSDIEIRRGGISYSIDTAREIKQLHPDSDIFFIIGSDSLPELRLWKDIDQLLDLCRFVTLARPGTDLDNPDLRDPMPGDARSPLLREQIRVGHLVNISSTDIRYRIAEGMSIRYLVHPAVEMYITEHSLFRQ